MFTKIVYEKIYNYVNYWLEIMNFYNNIILFASNINSYNFTFSFLNKPHINIDLFFANQLRIIYINLGGNTLKMD